MNIAFRFRYPPSFLSLMPIDVTSMLIAIFFRRHMLFFIFFAAMPGDDYAATLADERAKDARCFYIAISRLPRHTTFLHSSLLLR